MRLNACCVLSHSGAMTARPSAVIALILRRTSAMLTRRAFHLRTNVERQRLLERPLGGSASRKSCASRIASDYLPARLSPAICALRDATSLFCAEEELGCLGPRAACLSRGNAAVQTGSDDPLSLAITCYPLARASPASLTSILRSSPGPVTRSGKSSRSVAVPACRSMPSGSQPVQLQSAAPAPKSLVA